MAFKELTELSERMQQEADAQAERLTKMVKDLAAGKTYELGPQIFLSCLLVEECRIMFMDMISSNIFIHILFEKGMLAINCSDADCRTIEAR